MRIVGPWVCVKAGPNSLTRNGGQVDCVVRGAYALPLLPLFYWPPLTLHISGPLVSSLWSSPAPPPRVHVVLNSEQQSDRWLYSDWDFLFPGLFLYLSWLHSPLEICVLGIDLALRELSIWICLIVKYCLVFKAMVVHDEEQTCGCGFLVQRLHKASGA